MAEPDAETPAPATPRDTVTTVLMLVAAAAAVGGFGVLFSIWWKTDVSDDYEILRIASQEFVAGRPIIAGELAKSVEFESESDALDEAEPEPEVEPVPEDGELDEQVIAARTAREEKLQWVCLRDFLVGAGKVSQADQQDDLREKRNLLREAIPHLEASRKEGFPAGRQTDGERLLGESLFQLGKYDLSIPSLELALQRDPTIERRLLPTLAEAQLNAVAPLTEQALGTIERFLADPVLQPTQRWQGELIRIKALTKLKRWSDLQAAIDQAEAQPPTTNLKLEIEEGDFRSSLALLRAVGKIQQTIDQYGARPVDEFEDRQGAIDALADTMIELNDVQRQSSPLISAQAKLWAARAFLVQGMRDEALTRLTSVRTIRPFGAEAIVGGLEEIELLAEQGRGEEVLQTTRYLMRELGDESGFDARLITFDEFQRRMAGALGQLRRAGQYDKSIDTARSLPPVIDVAEAKTQEALGFREWAAATIEEGTDINNQIARSASVLARSRYRAAGDAFAEAARLQFDTEEYVPTQWSAIDAYQEGRHFRQSIRLLQPYLRYEERRRKPRGLLAYGRALLAEGDNEKAIKSLTDCIVEFPRDPNKYPARLLAASAHAENGDFDSARELLIANIQDPDLTPQSPSWRDSLFTLGELLYQKGYRQSLLAEQEDNTEKRIEILRANQPILEEASRILDESVERYWPEPRAESASYLSARANVLASRWPRIEAESPEILDAARRSLRAQADQKLQVALDGFTLLRKHLVEREEELRLPESRQKMLRNCYVAEADVMREMDRLEDAASSYRAIELRYMNEPPALEALLGRATCLRGMGMDEQADKLIRQASIVLQRIPAEWDDDFTTTTRYDRQEWESLLEWMNERLDNQGN